jgi:hypothetical protein
MSFLKIGLVTTPVLVLGASIAAHLVGCLH